MHINDLLKIASERKASDLHLKVGSHPVLRINGELIPLVETKRLMQEDTIAMAFSIMSNRQKQKFKDNLEIDIAYSVPGLGRFRCNVFQQRGTVGLVLRVIPVKIMTVRELGLPVVLEKIAQEQRGLILCTGTTGSGKSTSLAAMIDYINSQRTEHIITIEDPIEYEHVNRQSVIEQVEIGIDAPDFPTALRSALRQMPDVLVIGEMRDPESMRIALAAGETGQLVFSTVHTTDVPSTIGRMTDSFPAERQPTIRQEIAAALTAVFIQTLLPKTGGGRIPAAEMLVVQYGARQHIRRNAIHHLHQEITITRKMGSFTLEECLARLVKDGLVDRSDAALRANHPDDFEHAMRTT